VIVRSTRVVFPDGQRPAAIHVENGIITHVGAPDAVADRSELIDVGDLVVSPGLVDTHVHINEPGRTEWEGFDTATRAAAAGGVTTLVDMPLNSIPATTTVAALEAKRAAARGNFHVDVGFWGGVVPGNDGDLQALADAGARGFKCFLVPSGVDEFPCVEEADLRRALPVLARRDLPLLVHAELPQYLRDWPTRTTHPTYRAYLSTRPPEAEVQAIRLVARLAREFGVRTHIVHVAADEAVAEIEHAKADDAPVTAETCPHYLTFAAADIPDGATEFKCAPPIRDSSHREALWEGLRRGVLDLIATDHSPAPPEMKCPGDFLRAWGGIASLELSLAAVWTAVERPFQGRDRGAKSPALHRRVLAHWMSERPAALAGLGHRKGRIAKGLDADLVVWDPDAEFAVDAARLQQRHKLTPYANRRLRGRVVTTFVRGERVWDRQSIVSPSTGCLV
jgi:allantoinase